MKVETGLTSNMEDIAASVRQAEDAGYDGAWSAETSHDPFLPLVLAAEHSERIELRTNIAIAFARNPMTLANVANDLHRYSGGRFILGLGSQVKAHIERRYSMPWSQPAARMRELIAAMGAIWDCWNTGSKLHFEGDFYRHTLMTPVFDPGPNPFGAPKVFLAAVGPGMTKVAAEVADGMVVHGFSTERYVREVTLPAVAAGLAASGRSRADFQVCYPAFVVTGNNEEQMARSIQAAKASISFYGSTPSYRGVLELHGWGALHAELHALSRQGRWEDMALLVDDEVLDTFAVVAEPDQVATELVRRFGTLIDRISVSVPADSDPEVWNRHIATLRAS